MWSARNLAKVRQLGRAEIALLLEATFWLAAARLGLLLVPFRRIAPRLGQSVVESAPELPATRQTQAAKIGWAVRAIARRTPWESACLAQAISAKAMLRRRGVDSTLYLGLAKDKAQALQAHAWLRCGEEIITGKAGHERFSVISFFAEATKDGQTAVPPIPSPTSQGTDGHTLLLAAIAPAPQPATAEKVRRLDEPGWQELVAGAKKQHVLPLLLANLQTMGLTTAVPPHLLTNLKEIHQQTTLQNMAIYRELRQISAAMQAAEIPMIVLKGAYLAAAVYPHIGQRAMGDIDVLVPPERLAEAVAQVKALGWQETRPFAMNLADAAKIMNHLPGFKKPGAGFMLELHWNIAQPISAHTVATAELWADSVPFSFAGSQAAAFPPYLQLLHLALHAAYNHQFTFDLRSLCDMAMVISRMPEAVDWERFVAKAIEWRWQRGVYLILWLIQDFWPETAVPPTILQQLKPANMPETIPHIARQQILWGRKKHFVVSRNISQLANNKSPFAKAKYMLGFLLPSRNKLSWKYGAAPNSAKIWLYYFINLRDLVRRNSYRTWRLLRGNERSRQAADRRNQLSAWLTETQ